MRCVPRLALGLVVIGAAACGGGGDSKTAEGPATTIRVELTTTAPPQTTTMTAPPLSEEDQIRRTAAELLLAAESLYLDPDPARVADVYDPQCSCFAMFEADLADLEARDLRATAANMEILGVRLQDNSLEGLPLLTVVYGVGEHILVDAQGAEVERRPGFEARGFSVDLIGRGGVYLIAGIQELQLLPEVEQAVIAEGVP